MIRFRFLAASFLLAGSALASTPISADRFGTYVLVGGLGSSTASLAEELEKASNIGIGWVRMSMSNWDAIEPSSGVFTYTALDSFVSMTTTTYGMGFMLTLPISASWTPRASCPGTFSPTGAAVPCDRFPTTNAGLITRLSRNLASRYCSDRVVMEVHNEPDYGVFWKGETLPRTTDYIQTVLKPAYEGAKEGCPDMVVMMGGMAFPQGIDPAIQSTGVYAGGTWLREGIRAEDSLWDFTDRINVHIYETAGTTYGEDTTFAATVATITAQVAAEAVSPKNIWISETSVFGGAYSGNPVQDEEDKQVWMASQYAQGVGSLGLGGTKTCKIEAIFWHTLRAYTGGGDFSLYTSTFGIRPSYTTYATFWDAMEGAAYFSTDSTGGNNIERFKRANGKTVYIAWRDSGTASLSLKYYPIRSTLYDLDGGEAPKTFSQVRSLTATTAPIILSEESELYESVIFGGFSSSGIDLGQ